MTETLDDDRALAPLFDVKALLSTLWQRRVMIVAITIAVVALAGAYIAATKPVYTAGTSLLVDPRDSRATNFNSVLPGLGADSAAIASQVSVIGSRDLLGRVFDELGLENDAEYARRGLAGSVMSLVRTPKPISREARFESFRSHVSVDREGLTYVIDVNVKSHDPEKAARIANRIVKDYKLGLAGEKETANSTVTDFLTGKITGLQKDVADAERAVQDFKYKHRIYDAAAGGSLQSQIDQLSTQIGDAQDKADQAANRYQQAVDAGDTPKGLIKLADILSSSTADKLRQQYNQLAAELANAETVYGPRHPTILRIDAQLGKLRGLMVVEADRITAQLKAERDLAAENVKKLQDKLASLRQRSNETDIAQVKLRQLQSKADAARGVLDDFLKRSQETTQLKGMQISQVRVIGQAVAPAGATWPKPKLLLPVAAMLGLLAGCALAMLLGPRRAPAESQAEDADAAAPAVASGDHGRPVPLAPRVPATPLVPAGRSQALADLGTYSIPMKAGLSPRSMVKTIRDEMLNAGNSPLSLTVLRLLRRILGRLHQHDEPFVLLVSAVERGVEGKLAAAMIGIGLQHLDERVLLVEMADRAEEPGPLTSVSTSRGTSVFTDPSTRLPTAVLAHDNEIAAIIERHESGFDFVVIQGRALAEPNYSAALEGRADLTIFALAGDDPDSAAERLGEHFAGEDVSRKATIVMSSADNEAETGRFRPRLVAGRTTSRKPGSRAEG